MSERTNNKLFRKSKIIGSSRDYEVIKSLVNNKYTIFVGIFSM